MNNILIPQGGGAAAIVLAGFASPYLCRHLAAALVAHADGVTAYRLGFSRNYTRMSERLQPRPRGEAGPR